MIGVWNVRGLNKPTKQYDVGQFLQQNKIALVGLLETQIREPYFAGIYNNMFQGWGSFINNSRHPLGRIWVVWKPQMFDVQVQFVTSQMVHCWVRQLDTGDSYYLTFIYGLNTDTERKELWDAMRSIAGGMTIPWSLLGDFYC